jgi:uncharacterized membrane protein YkvA (DUF1232 family)|tara:strand:+ start:202 stop:645 length:444 start_codon:yes stop_codon:yes gene_type:complete
MEKDIKDFHDMLFTQISEWVNSKKGKRNKWSKYLRYTPEILTLLCSLSIDKKVPVDERAKLAGALAYFIAPIDLIPEGLIGPSGYTDDITVAALVLNSIITKTGENIVKTHWTNNEIDIVYLIDGILTDAVKMVGEIIYTQLKKIHQ